VTLEPCAMLFAAAISGGGGWRVVLRRDPTLNQAEWHRARGCFTMPNAPRPDVYDATQPPESESC